MATLLPPQTDAGMHFTVLKKSPPILNNGQSPTFPSHEEKQHARVSFRPSALRLRRWSRSTAHQTNDTHLGEPVLYQEPTPTQMTASPDQSSHGHRSDGESSEGEPPVSGSTCSTQRRKRASKIGRWNSEARERNNIKRASTLPTTAHEESLAGSPRGLADHSPLDLEQEPPAHLSSKRDRPLTCSPSHDSDEPDASRGRSPRAATLPHTTHVAPTAYKQRALSPAESTLSLNSLLEKFGVVGTGTNTNLAGTSNDSPLTHELLESQTMRKLGPLQRKVTFSCIGGVDTAKLLVITRQELLHTARERGGTCLVDESWSYKIKGRRGVYKVGITYSAMAAVLYMDELPVASSSQTAAQALYPSPIQDPQKPVALELAAGIAGLMTIQCTKGY